MTDLELLRTFAREKVDTAFSELVRRHQDMVYSACFRRLGSPEQAQDAAQQTFIRLVLKASSLLQHPCIGGWLYKTAMLEAGALMKKEANRRRFEQMMSAHSIPPETPPDAERLAGLDEAMLEMSDPDRNALILRFFEGRSLREVGQALGATEEAARKRITRALDQLAGLMRRRGATACTAAVLGTALADSTHAAPAMLLPSVSAAAQQASAVLEAASVATLTKAKVAAFCVLSAAVPGALQWHSNDRLRTENASLRGDIAELRAQIERGPPAAASATAPAGPGPVSAPEAAPPSGPADGPPNLVETGIAALLFSEAQQVDDTRHAKLTDRLKLSVEQQQQALHLLARSRQRKAEGISLLARGDVTLNAVKDVLQSEVAAAAEFRRELTAEQLPAYDQFLAEEIAAYAESSANAELARLRGLLNLSETQKDEIFPVLVAQAHSAGSLVEDISSLKEVLDRWEQLQSREAEAVTPLLDEGQQAAYRLQAAVRLAFVRQLLNGGGGKAPQGEEEPVKQTAAAADGSSIVIPVPDSAATVLIFSSTTCPIANGYAPELIRLHNDFRDQGVALVLVQTEAAITNDAAAKHAREFGLTLPVVTDPQRKLVRAAGATVTPEAVLLSPGGEILYRGRIDDRFPAVGRRWSDPRHTELRDAIKAVLESKPVPVPRSEAVGCYIE